LLKCLPDPDRRITSCPHGGATCPAVRGPRPADLPPLLEGKVSVAKAALLRLRRAG